MARMDHEFLSKGMRELGSCALYLHFGWLEQFVRILHCEKIVLLTKEKSSKVTDVKSLKGTLEFSKL